MSFVRSARNPQSRSWSREDGDPSPQSGVVRSGYTELIANPIRPGGVRIPCGNLTISLLIRETVGRGERDSSR